VTRRWLRQYPEPVFNESGVSIVIGKDRWVILNKKLLSTASHSWPLRPSFFHSLQMVSGCGKVRIPPVRVGTYRVPTNNLALNFLRIQRFSGQIVGQCPQSRTACSSNSFIEHRNRPKTRKPRPPNTRQILHVRSGFSNESFASCCRFFFSGVERRCCLRA
jgi:hypothetical protein